MVSDVTSKVRDVASGLADKAADALASSKEAVADAVAPGRERVRAWADDLAGLVRRHPAQALLLGFGAGVLTGLLLAGGRPRA